MAPSQLAIATSSLIRLVKEEKSYHEERKQQEEKIAKLEQGGSNDENADYILRQEASRHMPLYILSSIHALIVTSSLHTI